MVVTICCQFHDNRNNRNCDAQNGEHHARGSSQALAQDTYVRVLQPSQRIGECDCHRSFQKLRRRNKNNRYGEEQEYGACVTEFIILHRGQA